MNDEMFSWEVKTEKKRIVYSKMRLLNKIATGMDEALMKDELSSLDIELNASLNDCFILASGLQNRVLKQIPQGKYKYYSIAPLLNKRIIKRLAELDFTADTFYHDSTDDYCLLISKKGKHTIEEAAWEIQRITQEIISLYVLPEKAPFCVTTVYSLPITDYAQIEGQFLSVLKIKGMDFFEMKPEVRSENWMKRHQKPVGRLLIEELIRRIEKTIRSAKLSETDQAVDTLFEVLKGTLNSEICQEAFAQLDLCFLRIQLEGFDKKELSEDHFDSRKVPDLSYGWMEVKKKAQSLANRQTASFQNRSMITQKALYLIHCHYQDGITQKEIAEKLGVTPQYLSHLFNQEMKLGIPAYLNQLRIDRAKYLLLHTDLRAEQIVEMIGVNSLNQFYRLFKKYEGCTIMEYRKIQQN